MVSGGMSCVKYLLFAFNLVFAICGIAILTVGIVVQQSFANYSDFLHGHYVVAPIILIIVGVVVFGIAFFGCCGAAKENHCMIITFAVALLVIFALELAGGITAYVMKKDVNNVLRESMNMTAYEYVKSNDSQLTWDIMQTDLSCCGIDGPADWEQIFKNDTLPHTCCSGISVSEPCTIDVPHSDKGCLDILANILEDKAVILGGIGIGVAFVELIGIIFACCLAKSIRREYETV